MGYEQFVDSLNRRRRRKQHRLLRLATGKTYRAGTWDRCDDYPGVCFLSLHTIQKYNTIRMTDELIRYAIYVPSALEIASSKALMYVPFISMF